MQRSVGGCFQYNERAEQITETIFADDALDGNISQSQGHKSIM